MYFSWKNTGKRRRIMAKKNGQPWINNFPQWSPAFKDLDYLQEFASGQSWPSLQQLQLSMRKNQPELRSKFGQTIQFVHQCPRPKRFEDEYEVRIYQRGEVQTRINNWHDFFHALIWMNFPHAKVKLNDLHYHAMRSRVFKGLDKRNQMENQLTHFDECGAVIVSTDVDLLKMIKQGQWKTLFCDNKECWGEKIRCVVFGHALYEKLLSPYIGLCAHAILIQVNSINLEQQYLDKLIASRIRASLKKGLQPFPMLGIPGWFVNQNEDFYNNTNHFRPARANLLAKNPVKQAHGRYVKL